jgi:phosphatidylglycerol:prolipoprotein diacylglycerol transferase
MKYFYWISAIVLMFALIFFIFVPAFAGRLHIPPQINIGPYGLRLYGMTMALAVLIGYLVARKHSWRFGVSKEGVDEISFWLIIVAFFGARIYYVAFNWQFFENNLSEVYKIWHGGLSIYGAVITGIIFILIYARSKAYSTFQLLDLTALSMPLAQAIGRFGNFFNQEAYGLPTNLPWKMYIDAMNRPLQYRQDSFFHPTFLYESIASVIIYFVLSKFVLGKWRPGMLAFVYIGLYSVARFFIESIRLDSSYLHGIKVDQITAVVGVLVAGIMLIFLLRKGQSAELKKS